MSFKAILKIDGGKEDGYPVLGCSYSLNRMVDHTGRPASEVHGGEIQLSIESGDDAEWFDWMVDQWKNKNGSIEFYDRDEEQISRTLTFETAYLTNLSESFSMGSPFMVSLVLTAQKIGFGETVLDKKWAM
jgi:hypothetical protein